MQRHSIPIDAARRYHALPIRIDGDELVVAMSDPANILAIDDLRIVTGYSVRPVVATESDLANAIEKLSTAQTSVEDMMEDLEDSLGVEADELEEDAASDQDVPVVKLMNLVITEAIRQNAGNIYLEPHENEMRVRFRVDGVCQEILRSPKRMHRQLDQPHQGQLGDGHRREARAARRALLRGHRGQGGRLPRGGPTPRARRTRGHASASAGLDHDAPAGSGLSPATAGAPASSALSLPYGAILVTGPTDSGKTTTLYAAINETNDPKSNLITVEDPVEYRLPGLSQVQVHEKAGLTFSAALRSILGRTPTPS